MARSDRGAALLLVGGLALALTLYLGAYAAMRASGELVALDLCDSISPCPVAVLGEPVWMTAFAPAIAVEEAVSRRIQL